MLASKQVFSKGRRGRMQRTQAPPDTDTAGRSSSDPGAAGRRKLPETETAARLRAVFGKLSRRLRPTAAAASAGLTPTRVSVLLTVVRAGSIRLSDLAASEGINPTMLSRVVSDLADVGLLERISDQHDKRAAWVQGTAAARRLTERMRRERTDAVKVALGGLSPQDRRLIEDALPALEGLAEELKLQRWSADPEGGRA
jgi:DNA-binding MarR family transcriptional regulator